MKSEKPVKVVTKGRRIRPCRKARGSSAITVIGERKRVIRVDQYDDFGHHMGTRWVLVPFKRLLFKERRGRTFVIHSPQAVYDSKGRLYT